MCDPVTIAGIALTGAGVAANSVAASEVASARDQALAAERQRQAAYDQQLASVNDQSLHRFDNVNGQQTTKSNDLSDYLLNQVKQPQGAQAVSSTQPDATAPSNSNVTVQHEAAARDKAQGYTNQQATALGQYRSFGDLLGDIGRGVGQDTSLASQIGNFKAGSNNVLGLELADASHAGDSASLLGSVLGGIGGLGVKAGLAGGASKIAQYFAPAAPGAPLQLHY